MDYRNFNETSLSEQTASPIELHKTDYNNYADLSHFIEQYNIAQQLIKESQNFYKSFLVSKLMSWEQLINYKHLDRIDFYEKREYEIKDYSESFYWPKTVIETKYTDLLVSSYLQYLLKEEYVDKDKKLTVYTEENIPKYTKKYKALLKEYKKKDLDLANHVKSLIPFEILNKITCNLTSERYNKSISEDDIWLYTQHLIDFLEYREGKHNVINKKFANIYNTYKTEFDTLIDEYIERKKLYDEYITIENNVRHSTNVNKKERHKAIVDLMYETDVLDESPNKKMYGTSYYHFKYIDDKEKEREQLSKIHNYIAQDIIKHKCIKEMEEYNNYYIVDADNNIKFFSDDLSKTNIELNKNQTELICQYKKVTNKRKYVWPSDAPTIQTTRVYTVTFNTATNEVKDYDYRSDSDEIVCKRRW